MLAFAVDVGLWGLALSLALCLYRLWLGPSSEDRILALDAISTNLLALLVLFSIRWRTALYLEAAIVLALLAFVTTVALAKFLMRGRIIE